VIKKTVGRERTASASDAMNGSWMRGIYASIIEGFSSFCGYCRIRRDYILDREPKEKVAQYKGKESQ
jgi:hypothetical protein